MQKRPPAVVGFVCCVLNFFLKEKKKVTCLQVFGEQGVLKLYRYDTGIPRLLVLYRSAGSTIIRTIERGYDIVQPWLSAHVIQSSYVSIISLFTVYFYLHLWPLINK